MMERTGVRRGVAVGGEDTLRMVSAIAADREDCGVDTQRGAGFLPRQMPEAKQR